MALEAVLLFHSGGEWDQHKRARWQTICSAMIPKPAPHQGNQQADGFHFEATTRVLCDLMRVALEEKESPNN